MKVGENESFQRLICVLLWCDQSTLRVHIKVDLWHRWCIDRPMGARLVWEYRGRWPKSNRFTNRYVNVLLGFPLSFPFPLFKAEVSTGPTARPGPDTYRKPINYWEWDRIYPSIHDTGSPSAQSCHLTLLSQSVQSTGLFIIPPIQCENWQILFKYSCCTPVILIWQSVNYIAAAYRCWWD